MACNVVIDPEFESLIPPLAEDEYRGLEESILADGVRDALVVWSAYGILLDGHNRKRICDQHGIDYPVNEILLDDRRAARIWIRNNQMSRRNLNAAHKLELQFVNKDELLEVGREKQAHGKTAPGKTLLSNTDKSVDVPHDTRQQIAAAAGVATGTVAMAEVVRKESPELWDKAKAGDITINKAYTTHRQVKRRAEVKQQIESVEAQEVKALAGVYDVIIVDPPWPMEKIERDVAPEQVAFEYPTMSLDEIHGMEIPAADDCHVWLWTTHKYLPEAFDILQAWDMKYVCTFVWHKPGGFQPFNLPQYNCEFALYARRGTPPFLDLKNFPTCFNAPRGKHSEKPNEFYDMVRRVTGGRRLDMFNRRSIEGFDGWGKEAK